MISNVRLFVVKRKALCVESAQQIVNYESRPHPMLSGGRDLNLFQILKMHRSVE